MFSLPYISKTKRHYFHSKHMRVIDCKATQEKSLSRMLEGREPSNVTVAATSIWDDRFAMACLAKLDRHHTLKDMLDIFYRSITGVERDSGDLPTKFAPVDNYDISWIMRFAWYTCDYRIYIAIFTRFDVDLNAVEQAFDPLTDPNGHTILETWQYMRREMSRFFGKYYNAMYQRYGAYTNRLLACSVQGVVMFERELELRLNEYKESIFVDRLPEAANHMFERRIFLSGLVGSREWVTPIRLVCDDRAFDVVPYLRTGPCAAAARTILQREGCREDRIERSNLYLSHRLDVDTWPLWQVVFEHHLVSGIFLAFQQSSIPGGSIEKFSVKDLELACRKIDVVRIARFISFYPQLSRQKLWDFRTIIRKHHIVIASNLVRRGDSKYLTAWLELMPHKPRSAQRNKINKTLEALDE